MKLINTFQVIYGPESEETWLILNNAIGKGYLCKIESSKVINYEDEDQNLEHETFEEEEEETPALVEEDDYETLVHKRFKRSRPKKTVKPTPTLLLQPILFCA